MTEVIKEEEKKPVQLLLKNVEFDAERQHYVGDIVGDISYGTFTREAVNQLKTIQYLPKERELWEVENITHRYCSRCVSDVMYDEKNQTYYCPKCES